MLISATIETIHSTHTLARIRPFPVAGRTEVDIQWETLDMSEGNGLSHFPELIKAVCKALPDPWTLQVAKMATMKKNGHAAEYLEHYLDGKGDVDVDIKLLFKEDPVLKKYVVETIQNEIKQGKKKGVVPINQFKYGNQDWQYALGSININWTATKNGAEVSFNNRYRWHPNENRVTKCVHEAAHRLKLDPKTGKNVGEYQMKGKKIELKLEQSPPPMS
jgi:hypothetical protein